jgi:hypothetical protein
MTPFLPYRWYNTPNVRFLSIRDFRGVCAEMGFAVEKTAFLNGQKAITFWPNLRALSAIFLLLLPDDRAHAGKRTAKGPEMKTEKGKKTE